MAEPITDRLRWHTADNWKVDESIFGKQTIPTQEELAKIGENAGETIRQQSWYNHEEHALPEGRDERIYFIDSPGGRVWVTYKPDKYGWYVEHPKGRQYRPADLDELQELLEEMDHQINRYGDLL